VRCAIVGCGIIAREYAKRMVALEQLELVGVSDLVPERAEAMARDFDVVAYPSYEALLADDGVETVVNTTIPVAHAAVSAQGLEAGKHVLSEKPLALTYDEAASLVELARAKGVRLTCAPFTYMGEAQQTAWKLLREGAIGTVRVAYAEANWDRLERWHPAPQSLYDVGPMTDVGVYPITITTALFGRVSRVTAFAAMVEPQRITKSGVAFTPGAPDFVVAVLEHASGPIVRVTANFYVPPSQQRGLELHGDEGSLYLPTWDVGHARLQRSRRDDAYELVPLVRPPYEGIDWGRSLVDLVEAIAEGRPHRASAEHAAHVTEILEAVRVSSGQGGRVELRSDFVTPAPMDWALSDSEART
jgi:predicted dehydrogenase